ncbi:MAG: cobyric acid synthase [Euryarchaeota archaeon]|nr:cobyric acid synthase [Euryarchaeota archaeon]
MSLIILGTSSHVGKTITVAAVCRCLINRNITIAPFKSQNMSLNSYVTEDGAEIGIAQAIQAFAAGISPSADMNPVLLKPKGDRTSQVVLLGKPYKDVHIGEYYMETEMLLEMAVKAYNRLENKYSNIIIEGAGGAAELNLYDRDIANILLARKLNLPIILVGDIERGGVFAQLYGTICLLPDDIRKNVKGLIINKFRGDPALFEDGITEIEKITGLPVLGMVPYTDIPLPSEDSLSITDKISSGGDVRIAIIRLPRISNFSDFELLERYTSVDYVTPGTPLKGYDCIIIPGTKNTIDDLRVVKESGCEREIIKARSDKIPIIGICGGYQMLGTELHDGGIESGSGCYDGIGLLNITTTFETYRKTTIQVKRRASLIPPILSEIGEVEGYEIHMGESRNNETAMAFGDEGAATTDGLVFGTYMHALFRNINVINALLSYLYKKKGLTFERISTQDNTDESAYDALAEHFEKHVDMDFIASFFKGETSLNE